LNAIAFPTVRAYDPAFSYETSVIVLDGLKKLYEDGETAMYYLMVGNEDYLQPGMPEGCEEGIIRGIYKFKTVEADKAKHKVNLFGSGSIMNCALDAQKILADKYGISSNVWSLTSYNELRRDAHAAERWNMLHPDQTPRKCYVEEVLAGESGVFIAA